MGCKLLNIIEKKNLIQNDCSSGTNLVLFLLIYNLMKLKSVILLL